MPSLHSGQNSPSALRLVSRRRPKGGRRATPEGREARDARRAGGARRPKGGRRATPEGRARASMLHSGQMMRRPKGWRRATPEGPARASMLHSGHSCQTSNSPAALRATGSFQGVARRAGRRGTPEGRRAPPCYIQVKLQTRHPPFGRLARFNAPDFDLTTRRCLVCILVKLQTRHPPFGRLARFNAAPEGLGGARRPKGRRAPPCETRKLQTRHPPFGRLARFDVRRSRCRVCILVKLQTGRAGRRATPEGPARASV